MLRFKNVQSSWFRRLACHPGRGCRIAQSSNGNKRQQARLCNGRTGELKPTIRELRLLADKNKWRKETSNFLYFSATLCSEMSHVLFSTALLFRNQTFKTVLNTIHRPLNRTACSRRKSHRNFGCCCSLRHLSFICRFRFQETRQQAAVKRSHLTN